MSKLDNFKFGKSCKRMSAGEFSEFLKDRYGSKSKVKGEKLTDKEVKALVEREYGNDDGADKLHEPSPATA